MVYPRGCGGTRAEPWTDDYEGGLSPRVRGNRSCRRARASSCGSIPAGAGEPLSAASAVARTWVYPRGCGGTRIESERLDPRQGLSPRVRGNPQKWTLFCLGNGSIPAGAGEPDTNSPSSRSSGVYPRGCGGTQGRFAGRRFEVGLSPRVRGNPDRERAAEPSPGSIPAGAGEPVAALAIGQHGEVYPRGCGGTDAGKRMRAPSGGLSPRVRGNRRGQEDARAFRRSIPAGAGEPDPGVRGGDVHGSIPAGAGEPDRPRPGRPEAMVYPRGCGGTSRPGYGIGVENGLSPRVRGNPDERRIRRAAPRSIPAGAGEPGRSRDSGIPSRVYPRGCGGTGRFGRGLMNKEGLSPRVRGNRMENTMDEYPPRSIPAGAGEPHSGQRSMPRGGSIPAGAGEPSSRPGSGETRRVYPRGCGGTQNGPRVPFCQPGLSPRVRGNRDGEPPRPDQTRSIPAGAGEPSARARKSPSTRVYPRGCGGTSLPGASPSMRQGLSPRVRGNP